MNHNSKKTGGIGCQFQHQRTPWPPKSVFQAIFVSFLSKFTLGVMTEKNHRSSTSLKGYHQMFDSYSSFSKRLKPNIESLICFGNSKHCPGTFPLIVGETNIQLRAVVEKGYRHIHSLYRHSYSCILGELNQLEIG